MKCVLFNDPFDYHGHIGSGNGNRLHKIFFGNGRGGWVDANRFITCLWQQHYCHPAPRAYQPSNLQVLRLKLTWSVTLHACFIDLCTAIFNDDVCYELRTEPMNWYTGVERCRQYGGHLAEIRSAEQDVFLTNMLRNHPGTCRIKTNQ